MLFTRNGMAVRFDEGIVRPIGRVARGVRGITLKDEKEDKVVGCEVVTSDQSILVICENGYGKRSLVDDFHIPWKMLLDQSMANSRRGKKNQRASFDQPLRRFKRK